MIICSLIFLKRLSLRSADIKFPLILQNILHGIWLILIYRQSCWETDMWSFCGIISMIDSDNDGYHILSLCSLLSLDISDIFREHLPGTAKEMGNKFFSQLVGLFVFKLKK